MAGRVDLDFTGFAPQTVERVLRLLTVLDAINADSYLGGKVCLHGGTALNLFILDMPRLSVDIDLNYIGSPNLEQLTEERPRVERAVIAIGSRLGFNVTPGKSEHSGRSFRLQYAGTYGTDSVKIDLDYLNRSPLLPVEPKTVRLNTGESVTFPLNSEIELMAGKTKALVERVAVRDLYDICHISQRLPEALAGGDPHLRRRVVLYYLSISGPFPRPFRVADRFASRNNDIEYMLYPVLRADDRPTLDELISAAEQHVREFSEPKDENESEYLERADKADFAPELLFDNYPQTLAAARLDPAAAWKMRNLAKSQ
ncbi:MAG: nucleotidyl transferase AbiEii/AbiGii toxin family protein [Propionibacteriaceae bacterium]|jgi:predicted nucleotidyltransferase component of viral defense system|nr:nucleotidyl transferase AbiEii/AbiGii toxin family protein [Propionibacteriaceae bacterium]